MRINFALLVFFVVLLPFACAIKGRVFKRSSEKFNSGSEMDNNNTGHRLRRILKMDGHSRIARFAQDGKESIPVECKSIHKLDVSRKFVPNLLPKKGVTFFKTELNNLVVCLETVSLKSQNVKVEFYSRVEKTLENLWVAFKKDEDKMWNLIDDWNLTDNSNDMKDARRTAKILLLEIIVAKRYVQDECQPDEAKASSDVSNTGSDYDTHAKIKIRDLLSMQKIEEKEKASSGCVEDKFKKAKEKFQKILLEKDNRFQNLFAEYKKRVDGAGEVSQVTPHLVKEILNGELEMVQNAQKILQDARDLHVLIQNQFYIQNHYSEFYGIFEDLYTKVDYSKQITTLQELHDNIKDSDSIKEINLFQKMRSALEKISIDGKEPEWQTFDEALEALKKKQVFADLVEKAQKLKAMQQQYKTDKDDPMSDDVKVLREKAIENLESQLRKDETGNMGHEIV